MLYPVIVVTREGSVEASRILLKPHTRGGLVIALAGLDAVGDAIEARNKALKAGKRVNMVHATVVDDQAFVESLSTEIKALRAAASVLDMKVLLFGFDEPPFSVNEIAGSLGLDLYIVPEKEALELVEEGGEYGSLYVDTYLAAYFNLSGASEELLSKELGLYLAIKSILDTEGANALVLDCHRISEKTGLGVTMALNLLQDEGIPSSCVHSVETLIPQMISYSISGSPAIYAKVVDVTGEGAALLEAITLPTAVSSKSQITLEKGRVTITGYPGKGAYTLVSLDNSAETAIVAKVEVEREEENARFIASGLGREVLERLPSSSITLLKRADRMVVGKALDYLGIRVLSV